MPSSAQSLSSVEGRTADRVQAILLTDQECAAVAELGLRPTYSIVPCTDGAGDVGQMLANASLWMQAAEITSAGQAGRVPPALRAQVSALLEEAIPETLWDLERTTRNRDHWRSGDVSRGFPELGAAATEALYAEYIESERRLYHALKSLAAKLDD